MYKYCLHPSHTCILTLIKYRQKNCNYKCNCNLNVDNITCIDNLLLGEFDEKSLSSNWNHWQFVTLRSLLKLWINLFQKCEIIKTGKKMVTMLFPHPNCICKQSEGWFNCAKGVFKTLLFVEAFRPASLAEPMVVGLSVQLTNGNRGSAFFSSRNNCDIQDIRAQRIKRERKTWKRELQPTQQSEKPLPAWELKETHQMHDTHHGEMSGWQQGAVF